MLAINLSAAFHTSRLAVAGMKERGGWQSSQSTAQLYYPYTHVQPALSSCLSVCNLKCIATSIYLMNNIYFVAHSRVCCTLAQLVSLLQCKAQTLSNGRHFLRLIQSSSSNCCMYVHRTNPQTAHQTTYSSVYVTYKYCMYIQHASCPAQYFSIPPGWGRIINIASVHGLVASTNKSGYVATKFGVVGLTKVGICSA